MSGNCGKILQQKNYHAARLSDKGSLAVLRLAPLSTAEEVSASVEEMNASTEEISASAQNLNDVAQNLQRQVAKFKV